MLLVSLAAYILIEPRLCRLMCGKALPFRSAEFFSPEATPLNSWRHSLPNVKTGAFRKGKAFPHIRRQSRGFETQARAYRLLLDFGAHPDKTVGRN